MINNLSISMTKVLKIILAIIIISFNILSIFANTTTLAPIKITKGNCIQIPIAINFFAAKSNEEYGLSQDIVSIISNDLNISKIFAPISSDLFIETEQGIAHIPLFTAWSQINANILINGEITKIDSTDFKVTFVIWDVFSAKEITRKSFTFPLQLWRSTAHKIADQIYQHVTGSKGNFNTKIVYVSESNSSKGRIRRIAIMDQDGANHNYITNGKNHVITPVFSPNNNQILYVSYHNKIPTVRIHDLNSGNNKILASFNGITFSPRFSPDGNKILVSNSSTKNVTHIYEINLLTGKVKQLTKGQSINTSPSYSPDGSKIAFVSDRSGSTQIYIMNDQGSNIKRLTSQPGAYTTPAWSPTNNYIAFTKIEAGEFSIGVIKPDGSNKRIIATEHLVEGPSWAPDGKTIIFSRAYKATKSTSTKVKLYSVDYTGYNEREIQTPENASDPNWSNEYE